MTGKGGSSATLSVTYSIGPRAKIAVSPTRLHFAERAINSKNQTTTPACGSTVWNDELLDSPYFQGGNYEGDPIDASTRKTLQITNRGPAKSTLHYEVSFHTDTSSWLTEDFAPAGKTFQTDANQPLVPTAVTVSSGQTGTVKLASIANANGVEGSYPPMNQGTYSGTVEIPIWPTRRRSSRSR